MVPGLVLGPPPPPHPASAALARVGSPESACENWGVGNSTGDKAHSGFSPAGWPISGWLAGAASLAFVGSLVWGTVGNDAWAKAAANVGVPALALVIGVLAADAYYRKEGEKKVQEKVRMAAYTTLNAQYALERAHEPIRAALDGAYSLGSTEQVGELRAAEMAIHLAYGASYQTLHELDSLAVDDSITLAVKARFDSNSEALNATRPTVRLGNHPKTASEESNAHIPERSGSEGPTDES